MQEPPVKLIQKEERFILTCLKCGENHELWTDSDKFVKETFERFKIRHQACQNLKEPQKEVKVLQKSLFESEPVEFEPGPEGRKKRTFLRKKRKTR